MAMATGDPQTSGMRPSDVAGRRFPLARRGYQPSEVERFLVEVAERLRWLEDELDWHRARIQNLQRRAAAAQDAAYARLSQDFSEVVRRADEAATRVRLESEAGAAARLAVAGREAERVVAEARRQALAILRDAGATGVPPGEESSFLGLDVSIDSAMFDLLEDPDRS
jgi:DivIVA domain-containing protein